MPTCKNCFRREGGELFQVDGVWYCEYEDGEFFQVDGVWFCKEGCALEYAYDKLEELEEKHKLKDDDYLSEFTLYVKFVARLHQTLFTDRNYFSILLKKGLVPQSLESQIVEKEKNEESVRIFWNLDKEEKQLDLFPRDC